MLFYSSDIFPLSIRVFSTGKIIMVRYLLPFTIIYTQQYVPPWRSINISIFCDVEPHVNPLQWRSFKQSLFSKCLANFPRPHFIKTCSYRILRVILLYDWGRLTATLPRSPDILLTRVKLLWRWNLITTKDPVCRFFEEYLPLSRWRTWLKKRTLLLLEGRVDRQQLKTTLSRLYFQGRNQRLA